MIRKANPTDAFAIAALDARNFRDSLGKDFFEQDLKCNPFAHYWVWETDTIVGYLGAWISDNTMILNFCVDEAYRKQGYGAMLMDELFKVAVGIITLEVRVSNQNAIRFYEKRGFMQVSLRKNYYADGEDAILMIRE